jgi:hypothetical protein
VFLPQLRNRRAANVLKALPREVAFSSLCRDAEKTHRSRRVHFPWAREEATGEHGELTPEVEKTLDARGSPN